MLQVPVYLEVAAVFVGAVSGALHGERGRHDVIGVFFLALATSTGGGMIRDVLLQAGPPVALRNPRYLAVVVCASLATMLFASWLGRIRRVLEVVDSLLLGLWLVIGLEKGLAAGLPVGSVIFLGVITATGGGLLRDLLAGRPASIVAPGPLQATAALAGALGYVALVPGLGLHAVVGQVTALLVASGLRLLAIARGWRAPDHLDLREWWSRVVSGASPGDKS
jgi:uncharacterized membrane protein YeiH